MPAQETIELRGMTDAALRRELTETRKALMTLRFQSATRQLADVAQVANAKRKVARIQTLLRERAILAEADAAAASEG